MCMHPGWVLRSSSGSLGDKRAFSAVGEAWAKACCAVLSRSVVSDSVTPWTAARQSPLSLGILQARILEWVAMPSSRGSSQLRDQTQVYHGAGRFFYHLSYQGSLGKGLGLHFLAHWAV